MIVKNPKVRDQVIQEYPDIIFIFTQNNLELLNLFHCQLKT